MKYNKKTRKVILNKNELILYGFNRGKNLITYHYKKQIAFDDKMLICYYSTKGDENMLIYNTKTNHLHMRGNKSFDKKIALVKLAERNGKRDERRN